MTDRPLVTFFITAYKQERFIREAVEGALLQTYSPLEIILSDDCSPDRTFDIMEEMTVAYRGPHHIILNRNPSNLGIGGHINRVMDLSHGELIVAAAGDDISLPERTMELYKAWNDPDRSALSLFSAYVETDEAGNDLEIVDKGPNVLDYNMDDLFRNPPNFVPGCAHAWDRRIFNIYGPLMPDLFIEDAPMSFRSAYLGRIRYVPSVLVRYRRVGSGVTGPWASRFIERNKYFRRAYEQVMLDLRYMETIAMTNSHHYAFKRCAHARHAFYDYLCRWDQGEKQGIKGILFPIYGLRGGFTIRCVASLWLRYTAPWLAHFLQKALLRLRGIIRSFSRRD